MIYYVECLVVLIWERSYFGKEEMESSTFNTLFVAIDR